MGKGKIKDKKCPSWAWIIMIAFAVIIIIFLFTSIEKKEPVEEENNPSWHQVTNLIGTLKGGSYPFTIQGDKFRLTYSVSQDEDLDLLTMFVATPDSIKEGSSSMEKTIVNLNKSVTIIFPIMEQMGVSPITLTSEEFDVYNGNEGAVTQKIKDLWTWETEQKYENTGEISDVIPKFEYTGELSDWIPLEYVQFLGERKLLRNNYPEFFYSYNSASGTNISYAGAGEYSLIVDTYGVDSWSILIEDYY